MMRKTKLSIILFLSMLVFLIRPQVSLAYTCGDYTTQPFLKYVCEKAPVQTNISSDLSQKLQDEVTTVISQTNWAPYFYEKGDEVERLTAGGNTLVGGLFGAGSIYWYNPAEIFYTLSYTLPYLPSTLQNQVKTYLYNEIRAYDARTLKPYNYGALAGGGVGNLIYQGTRRESYNLSFLPNIGMNGWPPAPQPIENSPAMMINLYALWLYADRTGDWQYIQNHWTDINTIYNANKNIQSYSAIAGLIGYARMATYLNRTAEADAAANQAVQTMQAGLNFATFQDTADTKYLDNRNTKLGWRNPVFFYLVPEVGQYLKDNLKNQIQLYVDNAVNELPLWYIAKLGSWGVNVRVFSLSGDAGEYSLQPAEKAWSLFLTKAYILGENQDQLRNYLDIPWTTADLYYIQKLVATIEAPSTTPPQLKGDVNNDTRVDVLDVQACVNHILGIQDWGAAADVNKDGTVNVLDVQVIVNIILAPGA